ncbi:MAG TPA: hypothetical protein VG708_00280 [Mycobacteriales bacterium]|nr:hypothetical protein [Mycobacteriales bacterium]
MHEIFNGEAILRVLHKHRVDFVLIGGFAAITHGSPFPTNDIDVTPRTDHENYARLSDALFELDAKVRAQGTDPLPFDHDADSLAAVMIWNLSTRYGDLDVTVQPSGTRGYDDLRRDALTIRIRGVDVCVASLADIVRSKEAAGRDKDRRVLPVLRELVARETRARAEARRRR